VTVGGERDKVKPNGKNWLNSYGNRLAIPDHYLPSAGRKNPAVIRFHVAAGRSRGARRTIVTFWSCLSGVTEITHCARRRAAARPTGNSPYDLDRRHPL